MLAVYQVNIIRDIAAQKETQTEYYVSDNILKIIDKLNLELNDSKCKVMSISLVAPVLAIVP